MINCDQSGKSVFQDHGFHAGQHQHSKQSALRGFLFQELYSLGLIPWHMKQWKNILIVVAIIDPLVFLVGGREKRQL